MNAKLRNFKWMRNWEVLKVLNKVRRFPSPNVLLSHLEIILDLILPFCQFFALKNDIRQFLKNWNSLLFFRFEKRQPLKWLSPLPPTKIWSAKIKWQKPQILWYILLGKWLFICTLISPVAHVHTRVATDVLWCSFVFVENCFEALVFRFIEGMTVGSYRSSFPSKLCSRHSAKALTVI